MWCFGAGGSSTRNRVWTRCATWPSRATGWRRWASACRRAGRRLDVAGQVVTAGFVDLHSHAHDLGSARLQVADGVTDRAGARGGHHAGGGRLCGCGRDRSAAELRVRGLLDDGQDGRALRRHARWLSRVAVRQPRGPAVAARCFRDRNRPRPGHPGSRCRRRGAGDRPAGRVRARERLPGSTCGWRRSPRPAGCRPSPTRATSSSSPRTGPWTVPRRSSAPPARPVPACTTAMSTAPPSGTPTGCSGWSSAPSGRGRRSAPRPTPTAPG